MKIIAWDVDDTLNDFMNSWLTHWQISAHGTGSVNYSQLVENPPSQLLGIDDGAYFESIDAFRASNGYEAVSPLEPVLSWFRNHGHKARHLVLTAVPIAAAPASAAWVMRHFGIWVRSYNVVPSQRPGQPLPSYDRDKSEFLSWFGNVNLLVDDNPANFTSAKSAGFDVIGIPQPWNKFEGNLENALEKITTYVEG